MTLKADSFEGLARQVRLSGNPTPEEELPLPVGVDPRRASSFRFQATLQRVLAVLVPEVADYAFIHMPAEEGGIREVALAHRDPEKEPDLRALLQRLRSRMTAPGSVVERTLSQGVTQRVGGPSLPMAGRPTDDPGLRRLFRRLGPRSYVVVPVRSGPTVLGALTLARFESDVAYSASDLLFAESVGAEAALALEGAHLFEASERARAQLERRASELEASESSARVEVERLTEERRELAERAVGERRAREAAESRATELESRVEAAEAAREAAERRSFEDRARARLLDALGEAVVGSDREGRIVYWNRAAESLYGWAREEAVGRNLAEAAPAVASRYPAAEAIAHVLDGRSWTGELRLRRRDGSTFPALLTGAPVVDESGEPRGIVTVSMDLTDRRELERRTLQGQRLQAVARLAGGVAHDLNNVLTSINGFSELILQELSESDPIAEDVRGMLGSTDRASRLIRDLLAFSRQQPLRAEVVDLNRLLDGMRPRIQGLVAPAVEASFDLRGRGRVRADPEAACQVMLNLVANAADAMPGAGSLRIRTRDVELTQEQARKYSYDVHPGPYVHLTVEDTGTGIARGDLERVFEPFFTTREGGGHRGMGLSAVYGIVKQGDGYVWIDSVPGAGTTVHVYLPAVEAEAGAEGGGTATGAGSVVLLVEPDAPLRQLSWRALRRAGFRVLEAADGVEALRLWGEWQGKVAGAVVETSLPQMSPGALVERLRALRPDLPVLFVGASQSELELAGATVLERPFTPEALAAEIRRLLEPAAPEGTPRG